MSEDWIEAAAKEIGNGFDNSAHIEEIADILRRHAPPQDEGAAIEAAAEIAERFGIDNDPNNLAEMAEIIVNKYSPPQAQWCEHDSGFGLYVRRRRNRIDGSWIYRLHQHCNGNPKNFFNDNEDWEWYGPIPAAPAQEKENGR